MDAPYSKGELNWKDSDMPPRELSDFCNSAVARAQLNMDTQHLRPVPLPIFVPSGDQFFWLLFEQQMQTVL